MLACMQSGASQDHIFVPALFIMFMNDLWNHLNESLNLYWHYLTCPSQWFTKYFCKLTNICLLRGFSLLRYFTVGCTLHNNTYVQLHVCASPCGGPDDTSQRIGLSNGRSPVPDCVGRVSMF